MKLSQLLNNTPQIPEALDCEISGLCVDSRKVQAGDLFIAYPGVNYDGREHIAQALECGAVAIIQQADQIAIANEKPLTINLPACKDKVFDMAANFYGQPHKQIEFIGVTGTNGKTSVTQLTAQLLTKLGKKVATFGTLGAGIYPGLQSYGLTTPDPTVLMKKLDEFRKAEVDIVVMEVSSHGLDQARVKNIPFTTAIFTNLSRDHLDYHKTMQAYGEAKKKLFKMPEVKNVIVNADDQFSNEIISKLNSQVVHHSFGVNAGDIQATHCEANTNGTSFDLSIDNENFNINTQLLGAYNIYNLLAAITAVKSMGYENQLIIEAIPGLTSIAGRMEVVDPNEKPTVIVDYAHTPDALQNVLQSIRELCKGEIICVFGCGGDRDKGKRPLMARVAQQYADQVFVTSDNPRTEDPQAIIDDILKGFSNDMKPEVMQDRKLAISCAIAYAKNDDVVVIAGKGHETYQIIDKTVDYFNDAQEARIALGLQIEET